MTKVAAPWMLLALLCWSTAASGQVEARFYLQKNMFAPGEPVFVYFEAGNVGHQARSILSADPYSCCSGYSMHVSTDPSPTSSCALVPPICSCASSSMTLEPGAKYTERILLNYGHAVTGPGEYVVEATRRLPVAVGNALLSDSSPVLEVRQRLEFRVDPNTKFDSKQLNVWVDRLKSPDRATSWEAALVLASLAPLSIEDTLLGFTRDPHFQYWAPLAMHRLNTPRAMAALAQMLRTLRPGTAESFDTARFLAASGDPQWFPLLQGLALMYPSNGYYLYRAAESGGARSVPFLRTISHSGNSPTRGTAVLAMAYTGSRAAIPILLTLLNNSDTNLSGTAEFALQ